MPEILLPFRFNADIGYWDVSNVEDTSFLFGVSGLPCVANTGSHFNQDISEWDMRRVRDVTGMLYYTQVFDQPIHKWQITSVEEMDYFLHWAVSFNQDLSAWEVSHIPEEPFYFQGGNDHWEKPKPCWGEAPGSCVNASPDAH